MKTPLKENSLKAAAIAVALCVSACATTELTESGSKIRVLATPQQVSGCILVKYVPVPAEISQDAVSARHKALNAAAAAGADSIFIIDEAVNPVAGTSVYAEAMRCNK